MNTKHLTGLLLAILIALGSMGIASGQEGSTTIVFNGNSITVEGEGAAVADNTVTISAAGSYILSGALADGQVIVDTQDAGSVNLILDGAEITSTDSAAIDIRSAEAVILTLAEGTENRFSTDAADVEDVFSATIASTADLTIDGSGSLTVETDSVDGIVSSASITVVDAPVISVSAGDDGLRADQDLLIEAGTLTIDVPGKALHADYNLEINGGTIDILNSDEGIEAGFITLNAGNIHVNASDDGINISEPDDIPAPDLYMLTINGGTIVVSAEGDGIDSNGSIEMNGGVVIVNGPTGMDNGALDYDGRLNISGGLLVAVGSAGMAAAPNESSSQNSVIIALDAPQEAGTLVHIQNSAGEEVLTFAPAKTFQSVVFSSPELSSGDSYEFYYGGTSDGTASDGLYEDGSYAAGTLQADFTVSSAVTRIGGMMRGGPGGGRPPR